MTVVRDYIEYLRELDHDRLFDGECMRRIANVEHAYGQMESRETILEISLSGAARTCDYSICVMKPQERFAEKWLELDYDRMADRDMEPCVFEGIGKLYEDDNQEYLYAQTLPGMIGDELAGRLRPMLDRCFAALRELGIAPFQIGAMNGRGELASVRLFPYDMGREEIGTLLDRLGWSGDREALDQCLAGFEPYSARRKFIIDFDVFEDHISEKIGINFGTVNKRPETAAQLLEYFAERGLCLAEKKEAVLDFIREFPNPEPFVQDDISHFKLPFERGKVTGAKAYLRQSEARSSLNYRAWHHPRLMNLELTTRCPLHCPQCYCDMTHAEDMTFEDAESRVREGHRLGIRTVNLSGGETLCWKPLGRLVGVCSELGMESNIAISGFGFDRQTAGELIGAGVSGIYVSLNGSTREISEKSRDGYSLAISALALLRELDYPNICINWVMRRDNADDFDHMIRLAEDYGVRTLAVMMMKPDSDNCLPSVPDEKQLRAVARTIRDYRGGVQIEVEPCYSQLRAILGERALINLNLGIQKGCGAGRDGISVSVDNRLTPCRHLDIREDFDGIMDYWRHSEVLAKLRGVEDDRREPCGSCRYKRNCLPCMGVPWNMEGDLFMGDTTCPIGREAD